jgi:hypothetical protein
MRQRFVTRPREVVWVIWTVLVVAALIVAEALILNEPEDYFGIRDALAVMTFLAAPFLWGIGLGVIAFYAWLINEIRARG